MQTKVYLQSQGEYILKKLLTLFFSLAAVSVLTVSAFAADGVTKTTESIGGATAQVVYVTMRENRAVVPAVANNSISTDAPAASVISAVKTGTVVAAINGGFFNSYNNNRGKSLTYFILIVAGFISAIALILPGISVSYMFLLLGIYQETINAVQNLYIPYLIPLGFGLILGIILTTNILEYWMSHYVKSSYLIISGFVLGSIIQVFPGFPKNIIEWILCPLLFVSAYLLVRLLQRFDTDAIK